MNDVTCPTCGASKHSADVIDPNNRAGWKTLMEVMECQLCGAVWEQKYHVEPEGQHVLEEGAGLEERTLLEGKGI